MKDIFAFKSSRNSNRSQRNPYDLLHHRPNQVTYGSNSLRALAPKVWNGLPNEIKSADNCFIFKRLIKEWDGIKCNCNVCRHTESKWTHVRDGLVGYLVFGGMAAPLPWCSLLSAVGVGGFVRWISGWLVCWFARFCPVAPLVVLCLGWSWSDWLAGGPVCCWVGLLALIVVGVAGRAGGALSSVRGVGVLPSCTCVRVYRLWGRGSSF